ncbi:MAG: hypothetical protein M1113_02615 [Candidatus Thermoplasmatota archaeon]|nr:hypothetical protein [Candidatus Thermoplasmatota archaeon]
MIIDAAIPERSGGHIEGAGWAFDNTKGKSVGGMRYVTAVVSEKEEIFPLSLNLKAKPVRQR